LASEDSAENARGCAPQFLNVPLVMTIPAVASQVEVSSLDLNAFPLAQLTLDLSDQGGVKFDHFAAAPTREVVVWLLLHCLIVAVAFAETMLLHPSHILEQGESAVNRRKAEAGGAVLGHVIYSICL
jgi:hypothetical protein